MPGDARKVRVVQPAHRIHHRVTPNSDHDSEAGIPHNFYVTILAQTDKVNAGLALHKAGRKTAKGDSGGYGMTRVTSNQFENLASSSAIASSSKIEPSLIKRSTEILPSS